MIEGEDVKHLRNVLRVEIGQDILVSDGHGRDVIASIASVEPDRVVADIISERGVDEIPELPIKITLYQALPKADKMELIIQKCVELGVAEIVPVETSRCVVKLDRKTAAKKVERWQKIARSASEQCQRSVVPTVTDVMSWKEALGRCAAIGTAQGATQRTDFSVAGRVRGIICYEQESTAGTLKTLLEDIRTREIDELRIFVGPEGGFTEEEVREAVESGLESVTLGKRILRTETAGMALIAAVMLTIESGCSG